MPFRPLGVDPTDGGEHPGHDGHHEEGRERPVAARGCTGALLRLPGAQLSGGM